MVTKNIQETYPKAYKYFSEFVQNEFTEIYTQFESFPFEAQLGVFIAFFDQNSIDFQMYATDMEVLKESVMESFGLYEEYLFLDS